MIYDFSKEYLQLIEMHPDSSEAFIQGLDRLIARMNEVERRRILLDVGNDITKRAEKHKALFLKRFYHDQPSLHCYRLN